MMENRPNISTVGVVGGVPITSLILWVWNSWLAPARGYPQMTAEVAIGLCGVVIWVIQRFDRASKAAANHVINKYGDEPVMKGAQE